jgi:glucose uptake protein GlcU
MSLTQLVLCSLGVVLFVLGAINMLRKEKNAWYFLIPGILIFISGCLILSSQ